jgi:hypothetical protein
MDKEKLPQPVEAHSKPFCSDTYLMPGILSYSLSKRIRAVNTDSKATANASFICLRHFFKAYIQHTKAVL